MAFYANVVAEAAGFSAKTGIFLDAFSLRPMPEATFPQLRPSIIRPWEQRGARGLTSGSADVFGSSLNEVKTKKPGHLMMSGLPKTAATYSPNW